MDLSKFRSKLIGNDDERAVSPVIGVILMVAITVILAAVIAAFVLDMGDSLGSEPVNAVASVDEQNNATDIQVTVDDLGNADGVIVVDSSGVPVNTAAIESSGASESYTVGGDLTADSDYTVQAFQGEIENDADPIDHQAESTTKVGEFSTGS